MQMICQSIYLNITSFKYIFFKYFTTQTDSYLNRLTFELLVNKERDNIIEMSFNNTRIRIQKNTYILRRFFFFCRWWNWKLDFFFC